MASDTVSEFAEKTGSLLAEDLSQDEQISEVETKVDSLSEKITLCNTILKDLNELNGILVKKSLQDVSLPKLK